MFITSVAKLERPNPGLARFMFARIASDQTPAILRAKLDTDLIIPSNVKTFYEWLSSRVVYSISLKDS